MKDDYPWPKKKLTSQQKNEIRRRYQNGENSWDLAREFGVTASAIRLYGGARSSGHPGGQGYTSSGVWREGDLGETATTSDTVCHDEAPPVTLPLWPGRQTFEGGRLVMKAHDLYTAMAEADAARGPYTLVVNEDGVAGEIDSSTIADLLKSKGVKVHTHCSTSNCERSCTCGRFDLGWPGAPCLMHPDVRPRTPYERMDFERTWDARVQAAKSKDVKVDTQPSDSCHDEAPSP